MLTEQTTVISVGVVRNTAGQVLVIRRQLPELGKGEASLCWAFPGGKVRKEEKAEQAVEREVLEETGYAVQTLRQLNLRLHPEFTRIIRYFLCALVQEKPQQEPQEPDEIAEIRWVSPTELKQLFTSNLDGRVARELGLSL